MNARHEQSDIHVRSVAGFGLALALTVGLVLAGVAAFQHPSKITFSTPPGPQLQTHAREDLLKLRAAEDATLNSYGWVDRKAGVIHIPIERAMELTAQRGLPATKTETEVKP